MEKRKILVDDDFDGERIKVYHCPYCGMRIFKTEKCPHCGKEIEIEETDND